MRGTLVRRPRFILRLASVGALWAACTTSETTLRAPEGAQATTWVALAHPTGGPWSVGLAASEDPLRVISPALEGELYLLGYPQGAAEISGWLESGCPPCALSDPSWIYRRPLGEGDWSAALSMPEDLRLALVPDFAERCPAPGLCPSFRYTDAVLPVGGSCATTGGSICLPMVVVELEPGSVLVAQADGSLFRVREDGQSEALCDLHDLHPLDGWRNAAGTLWILGADRRLARLQVSALTQSGACPIEALIDPPEQALIERLAAGETAPAELYALTSSRALARYDGRAWEVLHRFPPPTDKTIGGLVWIEPDRVAAVRGTAQVVEWQRGQLRSHFPIPGTEVFLHALARAENGRLAVAIDGFGVYQADRPAGPWSTLPNTRSFEAGKRLLPWGPYWLLATANGVQVYHQGLGLCIGSFALTGRVDPEKLAALSPAAVLVAETQTYDAQGLVMRVLHAPRTDCSGR